MISVEVGCSWNIWQVSVSEAVHHRTDHMHGRGRIVICDNNHSLTSVEQGRNISGSRGAKSFTKRRRETRTVRTKVPLELFALVEEKVGVEHDGIRTRVKTRRERLREVHTRISKLRR